MDQESSVSVVTGYLLDRDRNLSRHVRISPRSHPVSYALGLGGSFSSGKAAVAFG